MIPPKEYGACQSRPLDQTGYDLGRIGSTIYVVAQVDFDISPGSGVSFILIDQLVTPIKQVGTAMYITNGIDREVTWRCGVFMLVRLEQNAMDYTCRLRLVRNISLCRRNQRASRAHVLLTV